MPLYAKECYGWDVLKANSIAETESSAIAYYFYAMQKGRELNLKRLVELGLYIRFVKLYLRSEQTQKHWILFNRRQTNEKEANDEVASSEDENFLDKIGCS